MHIHIIMHEAFESPGAILQWIESRGINHSYSRLYEGDKLPVNADSFDVLLVMGGPQSPDTTLEECPYFDSEAEQKLIRTSVNKGKIVLGICLGAQMISNALGGQTQASPEKEIGLFEIKLTDEGKKDAFLTHLPNHFKCGHWHGDMPGLTNDAVVLAHSEGCPRQIIRFAPKVYAFQCHFEFTPSTIEDMIKNSLEELEREKDKPFVQAPAQLRTNDYSIANQLLFEFLDRLVKQ
ncbi:MAG: gamma-glutamyl-gamma-aminobutyrate hydrolase family protein [Carboxylicivirga sp.]|jgi:GMP synthase (glutamine-hydrolysing)|nr:gamma-glutamyl-gamma-aminobutyrate hydrolase family protein [Carboxylicivirga sp.]